MFCTDSFSVCSEIKYFCLIKLKTNPMSIRKTYNEATQKGMQRDKAQKLSQLKEAALKGDKEKEKQFYLMIYAR